MWMEHNKPQIFKIYGIKTITNEREMQAEIFAYIFISEFHGLMSYI